MARPTAALLLGSSTVSAALVLDFGATRGSAATPDMEKNPYEIEDGSGGGVMIELQPFFQQCASGVYEQYDFAEWKVAVEPTRG